MDMDHKGVAASRRGTRSLGMGLILLCLLVLAGSCRTANRSATDPAGQVGPQRYITPVHQVLTPIGIQVELPGMRPQGLVLSPDGRLLATAGKTQDLVLLDPQSGAIKQRVALPSGKARNPNAVSSHILEPDEGGQLSFTGLIFSPDGSRLYLSNVSGDVKVFGVGAEGQAKGLFSIALPAAEAPRRLQEIPAGLAISRDGRRLYVALNLSNRLAEVDTATGKVLRMWPVGVAPYGVALVGDKAYVSNWGGRAPGREQRYRAGRPGYEGARGPGALHRQRRLGLRDPAGPRDAHWRDHGRSAFVCSRGYAGWTPSSWWPTPAVIRSA